MKRFILSFLVLTLSGCCSQQIIKPEEARTKLALIQMDAIIYAELVDQMTQLELKGQTEEAEKLTSAKEKAYKDLEDEVNSLVPGTVK